jgi:hypothetical protein
VRDEGTGSSWEIGSLTSDELEDRVVNERLVVGEKDKDKAADVGMSAKGAERPGALRNRAARFGETRRGSVWARGDGRDVSDSTLVKLGYLLFANHSEGDGKQQRERE